MSEPALLPPPSDWSRRLASSLAEKGIISKDEAAGALAAAAASGRAVGAVLAESGVVAPSESLSELSLLSGLQTADLVAKRPEKEALAVVPELLAREIRGIGYEVEGERLVLACSEPLPLDELRQLSEFLEREVAGCLLADPEAIEAIIEGLYADQARDAAPHSVATGQAQVANQEVAPHFDVLDEHLGELSFEELATASEHHVSAPRLVDEAPLPPSGHRLPHRLELDGLLTEAVKAGASDIHVTEGVPPMMRVDGALRVFPDLEPLDGDEIREMVYQVLTQSLRERFEEQKELDTAHVIFGVARFRMNVFRQRGATGAVLRVIPQEIPPFSATGMPEVVASFAELRRGLVLVTGPTGSGKSTTLASIIDIVNRTKPLHIVTIEDPIEFLHTSKKAVVNQREIGIDTMSFGEALRHVLRQDPDVILVGELRDVETIGTALTAAETGHLVFATLHTQDAPQTIDRIIDVFPTSQQDQIRIQLAGSLEAVVTQQLVPSANGTGRVPVAEVMICTPAIRNLIRSAKSHQIYSLMQTGGTAGMQTMDQALARAIRTGRITEAAGFDRAHDPAELRDQLRN